MPTNNRVQFPTKENGFMMVKPPWYADFDNSKLTYPSKIKINDTRKIRATTGKPMVETRDYKTSNYSGKDIYNLIKSVDEYNKNPNRKHDIDKKTIVAQALAETGIGKDDPNLGHVIDMLGESASDAMVYKADEKLSDADRFGLIDEAKRLQIYNGNKKLFPRTEEGYHASIGKGRIQSGFYGVPFPKEGYLDMKKNPLYGKEVIDLRDNVISKNQDIQNMVDTVGVKQPVNINGETINRFSNNSISETYATGGQLKAQNNIGMTPYLYNSLPQYGLGSWLEENAGTIGSVAGGIGGFLIGGPAGMALGSAALGGVGNMITQGHNQAEQNDQKAEQTQLQQQQMSTQNAMNNYKAQEHPMYGTNFAVGGFMPNVNTWQYSNVGGMNYANGGKMYGDGGEVQPGMTGMMKARLAMANEFGNKTAQRLTGKDRKDYAFTKEDADSINKQYPGANSYPGQKGNVMMGSYDNFATPSIQDVNGKLQYIQGNPWQVNPDRSYEQSIKFERPEDAEYFGKHYKEIAPVMQNWNENHYANGGGIHINPANVGKFNVTKDATGKTTEELTHSSNPITKKRAIFAQNAAKWHHADGGQLNDNGAAQMTKGLDNITVYANGGTHEQNSNGGIPIGKKGLVEQGEVRYKNYIFSNKF